MVRAKLSLDVSDSKDEKIMRVFDTSLFCDDDVVENYIVEVLPVNKTRWIPFHVAKGFSLALNSSNLQYRKVSDVTSLIEIPDGIYEFRQSFKPNIQSLTHFLHFRTTHLYNRILSERDKIFDMKNRCDRCNREFENNLEELRDMFEYVESAKWAVEQNHDKAKGKELYEHAKTLLEKYTSHCQC